ncbi:hypothetical protein [Acrocarpospora catenulata]|uniref:hypothetical protein n=1 Tax=Acrocarpospora catenulata TaxID=2836182 RepID=UPI001BDA2E40|nr:hypothetical protein [Acrocarpospora catenulata]
MPTLRDVHTRHAVRRIPLGDLSEVLIDLRDGELILRRLGLVIAGTGHHLRLILEHRSGSRTRAGLQITPEPTLDAAGEPVVVDDQGRVTTLHRDADGLITKIVDPLGAQVAAFTYDPAGRPTRQTDATGGATTFRWDEEDRLTGLDDPAGGTLNFAYGPGSAVTAVDWRGDGGSGRITFGYAAGQTTVTDAAGRTTVHTFDERGRLVAVTDPLGGVRRWTWATRTPDTAAEETDALGAVTAYDHDDEGRLVGVRLPATAGSSAEYGHPGGQPTVLRDPAGNELRLEYDAAGRQARALVPGRDEPLDVRTYHPAHGRLLTLTDGNGQTTSFGYDEAGNLVTVTPPEPLGPTRYAYDRLSRIVGVIDGNGRRTGYRHDQAGRLTEVTDEDAGTVLASLAHDALGRVTRRSGPGWSYAYDWTRTGRGSRLARAVRTADGEPAEEVRYTHAPDGELLTVTTPGGTTRYTYDGAGRPATVTGPSGHTARLTHDAAGRLVRIEFGGDAVQEIGYDAAGRRTSLTVRGADGGERLTARYAYGDRDVLQRAELDGEVTEYTYDELKRLARAGATEYVYDRAHNLLRLGEVRFTLNAAGQVTRFGETEFAYDGAGNFVDEVNPTGSFTYSATHQTLTGVFGGRRVVDVAYDGLDQRTPRRITETTVDGRTVTHVLTWSELGLLRVTDDGVPTDLVRSPDGVPLAVLTADKSHYWTVTDQHGSVLALLGEGGEVVARYRYTPHGAVTASGPAAAAGPLRFRGGYQLLRSAHLLDDHLYNGHWGRFTQPDPTRRAYAPYTFRDNDPVNTGTWTRHDFWAVLASGVAARFFPAPPEHSPYEPGVSTAPGIAADRTPLVAGEPPDRFPLHS